MKGTARSGGLNRNIEDLFVWNELSMP